MHSKHILNVFCSLFPVYYTWKKDLFMEHVVGAIIVSPIKFPQIPSCQGQAACLTTSAVIFYTTNEWIIPDKPVDCLPKLISKAQKNKSPVNRINKNSIAVDPPIACFSFWFNILRGVQADSNAPTAVICNH